MQDLPSSANQLFDILQPLASLANIAGAAPLTEAGGLAFSALQLGTAYIFFRVPGSTWTHGNVDLLHEQVLYLLSSGHM